MTRQVRHSLSDAAALLHLFFSGDPAAAPQFGPRMASRTVLLAGPPGTRDERGDGAADVVHVTGDHELPPLEVTHGPGGWTIALEAGAVVHTLDPMAAPDEVRSPALFSYGGHVLALKPGGERPDPPPAGAAVTDGPRGTAMTTNHDGLAAELGRLARIARSKVPVMIVGETGTGKELVARALHHHSGRPGRLVAVNCGALPRELVHAQLFGHNKGAFSGAHSAQPGFVREAEGGTLFLDEIAELPLEAQPVLLRCLQESEVTPVGAARPAPVNFRLVSATNRDLAALVAAGQFRQDLYSRLIGLEIQLPPLRERPQDVGLLVRSILGKPGFGHPPVVFDLKATLAIFSHGWPMNVRELERCLESATVLAAEAPIGAHHLPAAVAASASRWRTHRGPVRLTYQAHTFAGEGGGGAESALLSWEDQHRRDKLIGLLRKHRGNVAAVSQEMGKARMQIHRWLKRYAINPCPFRVA